MHAFTIVDVAAGMLLAIVVSLYVFRDRERARAEHIVWVSTRPHLTGVVDQMKAIPGADETTYIPVIVYTLANGQRYAIDGESSAVARPPVGTEVEIAYEPTMPSMARLVIPSSVSTERSFGDVIAFGALTFAGTLAAMFIRAAIEWVR